MASYSLPLPLHNPLDPPLLRLLWAREGVGMALSLQSVSGHVEWVATSPRVAFMGAVIVIRLVVVVVDRRAVR